MKNKENFSEDRITIKIIKTDIWFAKKGLSPFQNPTNDEAKFNISAYHAQQATEKCIKIILQNFYNVDTTTKKYRQHHIPRLLQYLEECAEKEKKPIPIKIPKVIKDMGNEITSWEENMRYNIDYTLLKSRVKIVISACEQMVKELKISNFK